MISLHKTYLASVKLQNEGCIQPMHVNFYWNHLHKQFTTIINFSHHIQFSDLLMENIKMMCSWKVFLQKLTSIRRTSHRSEVLTEDDYAWFIMSARIGMTINDWHSTRHSRIACQSWPLFNLHIFYKTYWFLEPPSHCCFSDNPKTVH